MNGKIITKVIEPGTMLYKQSQVQGSSLSGTI